MTCVDTDVSVGTYEFEKDRKEEERVNHGTPSFRTRATTGREGKRQRSSAWRRSSVRTKSSSKLPSIFNGRTLGRRRRSTELSTVEQDFTPHCINKFILIDKYFHGE